MWWLLVPLIIFGYITVGFAVGSYSFKVLFKDISCSGDREMFSVLSGLLWPLSILVILGYHTALKILEYLGITEDD